MGHPQCLKVGLKVAKMHKEEEDYGNTQLAYKARNHPISLRA
jgi:hypothetical protein